VDTIRLAALVATTDGARQVRAAAEGDDPERVADQVAEQLLHAGADRILAEVRTS
jgi:porphobilinogen deaminase